MLSIGSKGDRGFPGNPGNHGAIGRPGVDGVPGPIGDHGPPVSVNILIFWNASKLLHRFVSIIMESCLF